MAPPALDSAPAVHPELVPAPDAKAHRAPRLWLLAHPLPALLVGVLLTAATVVLAVTVSPLAGVAGVVVAAGVGLAAVRPDLAGLVVVWLAPLTPGLARGLVIPGLKVSELVIVGASTVVLVASGRRAYARFGAVDWLFLAYAGATLLLGLADVVNHGLPLNGDTLGALLGPLQFFLLFRLVRVTLVDLASRARALRGLLVGSLVAAALAVAQSAGVGAVTRPLAQLTGADYASRALGPYSHWHDLAGYGFLMVVVAAALLLTHPQQVVPRWLAIAALLASAASIVTSLTMVAMLGTAIALVLLARRTGRGLQLLGIAVTAVVLGAVTAGDAFVGRLRTQFDSPAVGSSSGTSGGLLPQTISYRLDVWLHQTLPNLEPYLAVGYGPQLPDAVVWRYTESMYLTLILRGGLVLLVIFLALFAAVWILARAQARADDPAVRALGLAMVGIVPAALVMNLINPYFTNDGFPHLFSILAGLLAVTGADVTARPAARPRVTADPAAGVPLLAAR